MEIVIVLLAILMLFGAKGIPDIARGLGRGVRQMKDAAGEVQREITKSAGNIKNDMLNTTDGKDVEKEINDVIRSVEDDKNA
jgi:sec-independent protein translocase protein TatA